MTARLGTWRLGPWQYQPHQIWVRTSSLRVVSGQPDLAARTSDSQTWRLASWRTLIRHCSSNLYGDGVSRIILLPIFDIEFAVATARFIFDVPSVPNRKFDIESVVLSSAMALPWQAKPSCPAHLRDVIERFVNAQDPAWRLPPAPKGEVFESFEQCQQRLNVWAIVEGFAVVVRGRGDPKNPCMRFLCIHHNNKTRNN